jgi:hypothetical protein
MSAATDQRPVDEIVAVIAKIIDLAGIPNNKRNAFIDALINARQLARYREIFSDRLNRSPANHAAVIDAQRKVLAARDAVAHLSPIDLAMLDRFGDAGESAINIANVLVQRFALLTGTDRDPQPTSGRRGRRKGTSNDPIFREFLALLCGAVYLNDGRVTFSGKSTGRGTRVTGTLIEILTVLQPHLSCIPRELSSRAELIDSMLKGTRPRKGGQNSK